MVGLVQINIQDNKKNRTKLTISSTDKNQYKIEKGTYDVLVDGVTVLKDFSFKSGAVYTVNMYEDNGLNYVSTSL